MSEFPKKRQGRPVSSTNPRAGRQRARYWVSLKGPCQRCAQKPATDRHHVDGNPLNNEPHNIVLLCRRCHMTVDGRILRGRPKPTHCKHGHEFTPENTYTNPTSGKRSCRTCRRRLWRAHDAARRVAA